MSRQVAAIGALASSGIATSAKPAQELEALYAFVSSDPVNQVDLLGLSGGDVLKMFAVFRNTFLDMCRYCKRTDYGWVGNAISWYGGTLGCQDQEKVMEEALNRAGGFQDKWSFVNDFTLTHNWVSAVSKNPADPEISLDTWKGCFEVKFRATPGANWKQCFQCNPCRAW
jgi:hypothetical protein